MLQNFRLMWLIKNTLHWKSFYLRYLCWYFTRCSPFHFWNSSNFLQCFPWIFFSSLHICLGENKLSCFLSGSNFWRWYNHCQKASDFSGDLPAWRLCWNKGVSCFPGLQGLPRCRKCTCYSSGISSNPSSDKPPDKLCQASWASQHVLLNLHRALPVIWAMWVHDSALPLWGQTCATTLWSRSQLLFHPLCLWLSILKGSSHTDIKSSPNVQNSSYFSSFFWNLFHNKGSDNQMREVRNVAWGPVNFVSLPKECIIDIGGQVHSAIHK